MKSGDLSNLFILFFILIVLGFLYKKYTDKLEREEKSDSYEAIRNFLLEDETLGKKRKPILWVYVPYEYNARQWLSFGSRTSTDLNQPYLYLTMRTIIKKCNDSFTVCIIDDTSFKKLLPDWSIDMSIISDPILHNIKTLGIARLIHTYGGMACPLSFLCTKDLVDLYRKGTHGEKMFVCETVNRNATSVTMDFFPDLSFYGAPRDCSTTKELIHTIQNVISTDYTAESVFSGELSKWAQQRVECGKINLIDGKAIGVKTVDGKQVTLDDLMSNSYIKFCPCMYGILIPCDEILKRNNYEWFARLSEKQVLKSNTIIGNYILLSVAPGEEGVLNPLEPVINKGIKKEFVGFWRTPLLNGFYGLKPNFLGDNMQKVQYLGQ